MSSKWSIVGWVICLALLSVGARNFEMGLSLDGPLYAAIARNIARSGELFYMHGSVPDFQPFAEHPHLGFWLHALVFKIFPAADWAARIPSHLFYIGFLLSLYFWVRKISGEWVATITLLLLWIWPVFSNYFSNFYLDPGALFFGLWAIIWLRESLRRSSSIYAVGAGLALGLCALYKGLTVLGFGPTCAFLVLSHLYRYQKIHFKVLGLATLTVAVLGAIVFVYWRATRLSSVPQFFELYWSRQVTHRFGNSLSLGSFLNLRFWLKLLKDTYYLFPLAFLSFRSRSKEKFLPWIMLLSFFLVYGPTDRVGGQYWLMVLPWAAWLIALACEGTLSQFCPPPEKIRKYSARLAIAAVCVIQYGPIPTHSRKAPGEIADIQRLKNERGANKLYLGVPSSEANFVNSAPFAWYGDIGVEYNLRNDTVVSAAAPFLYLNYNVGARPDAEITARGWCLFRRYEYTSLWAACP